MKRALIVLGLVLTTVIGGLPSQVQAASAAITPSYQVRSHGQTASWALTWGGGAPYSVNFAYGDGGFWSPASSYSTLATVYRTWWPCSSTNYYQSLYVNDTHGNFASAGSTTVVTGGSPC